MKTLLNESLLKRACIPLLALLLTTSLGCASAGQHREAVRDDTADRLTVG
jgi:hypothetical protein